LLIDRASILAAGAYIANHQGLGAVSMRAVARDLGVTPMALYRHVADKTALFEGLVDVVYEDVPAPPRDLPWRERIRWIGEAVRGAVQRNPGIAPLLLGRSPDAHSARPLRDWIQRDLRAAGISRLEAPRVERVITTALLGCAAREAAGLGQPHLRDEADLEFSATLRMIDLLIDDAAPGRWTRVPPTRRELRTGSTA
jgi:AcrR family transcriptional regulator